MLLSPDPTIGAPDISTDALFWALRLPTVQGDAYFPKRTPDPSALTPQEKTVLLHLADHADTLGECFPSVGFLSRKTGLAESSVRKYLRRLQDRELIHGTEQTTTAGRTTSTLYRLALPDLEGPVRLLSMDVDRTHRETAPPPTEARGGTHRETVGDPPGGGGSSITYQVNLSGEPISGSAGEKIGDLLEWWESVLEELKRVAPRPMFDSWLRELTAQRIKGNVIEISPPNAYVGEMVSNRCTAIIEKAIAKIGPKGIGWTIYDVSS
mgnify:CR=1 FL=1